jgi:hemolysin III
MLSPHFQFPSYSRAERLCDAIIHAIGLVSAPLAAIWLLGDAGRALSSGKVIACAVYCFGLIGMISASALYHFTTRPRLKRLFRRLDHHMIFVMIAGTYTPLSIAALRPGLGLALCAVVWMVAACGIALSLARPDRHERLALGLYLFMGWMALPLVPALIQALPPASLILILAGGLIYSLGTLFHIRTDMPFHNAIWHVFVLVAAALHLVAIDQVMAPTT